VDNVESRVKGLEDKMQDILKLLHGNGQPGLISKVNNHQGAFNEFIAAWKQRVEDEKIYDDRAERERYEQKKTFNARMNILIGIAGIILALVTCVVCVLSYERATGHAILSPIHNSDIYNAQILEHYNSTFPTLR
jgi:hypothetical protein